MQPVAWRNPKRYLPGYSMPHAADKPPFDALARKWHALAERRLLYYGELYTSGRWTRYFDSREQFARHMIGVIKAAKIWGKLAGIKREAGVGQDAADKVAADKDDIKSAA